MTPSLRTLRFFHPLQAAGLLLAAALLLGFRVPVAFAQEGTPVVGDDGVVTDDQVNAIAKQMFCPVCENVPLDVCPTQACHQWRETIRTLIAEGKTEQEIKDYFVQQYGDRVLAAPPPRGFNWLVYIIPPLVLLFGAGLLFTTMRSWKKTAPAGNEAPPTVENNDYVRRLEDELKRRG